MPAKEELTQIERDKLDIHPDFDFRDIAQRPFEDITTNEIGMFKWSGVYHQLQKGFFMIRLRLPGGLMTSAQLHRAADLAQQYGQNQLCITTRQTLQFHWIRKEDIYKILEGMQEVGITSRNACGDVSRNVVTCSMMGVCPHELADTRKVIDAIADDSEILDQQRNLPRKHKISVAGCGRACAQTLMNCQGWHPVETTDEHGSPTIGWKFHAGGGLGARPYMGKLIFDYVPEDLVLDVVRASTEAFRRHGNRRKRAWARLKILVDKLGAKGYGELVMDILRERNVQGIERIRPADGPADIGDMYVNGQSVLPQRQQGTSTVRIMALRSELTGEQAHRLAELAETFGSGMIMYTNRQNLDIRDVPDEQVEQLRTTLAEESFRVDGFERLPDMVACVGTTQCNLAVSDTPNTWRALYEAFGGQTQFADKIGPLRINMNGCPNSCAQHWIADIGLRGTRTRQAVGSEEGFSVFVGGSLAGSGHIGEFVCDVTANRVVAVIRSILEIYLCRRYDESETFGQFARRIGGSGMSRLLEQAGALLTSSSEPVNVRNMRMNDTLRRVVDETS